MKLPTSLRFLCDDGDDEGGADGGYENLHWKNDEGTKVPTSLCMPPPIPLPPMHAAPYRSLVVFYLCRRLHCQVSAALEQRARHSRGRVSRGRPELMGFRCLLGAGSASAYGAPSPSLYINNAFLSTIT